MIWQDVVLLLLGGWVGRGVWDRARRGKRGLDGVREAVTGRKRRREAARVPSVTEVAG